MVMDNPSAVDDDKINIAHSPVKNGGMKPRLDVSSTIFKQTILDALQLGHRPRCPSEPHMLFSDFSQSQLFLELKRNVQVESL